MPVAVDIENCVTFLTNSFQGKRCLPHAFRTPLCIPPVISSTKDIPVAIPDTVFFIFIPPNNFIFNVYKLMLYSIRLS